MNEWVIGDGWKLNKAFAKSMTVRGSEENESIFSYDYKRRGLGKS